MLRNKTVGTYCVSGRNNVSEGKEGILNMNRSTGAAITTACISAAVGTAAYMAVNHRGSSARAKKLKKTTGRALRQVGDFIDNVSYMMR